MTPRSGAAGAGKAGAPSLVRARQRSGKNNCPRQGGLSSLRPGKVTKSPRVEALRKRIGPCTALPADRIALVNLNDRAKKVPMRCKRWHHHSCTNCGAWMRGRFIKVCREQAEEHNLTRFLTLTLGTEARNLPIRDQFLLMSKAWAEFRKRVGRKPTHVRKNGQPVTKNLSAVWVRELHKDGTPHLHVVIDRYLHQRWISQTWQECGGGPVVDIRRCTIDRVVAYISKYLAKGLDSDTQKEVQNFRRYGAVGEASTIGVYPVKRGDEPYWPAWRPEVPSVFTHPDGWELAGVGNVGEVISDIMTRYGGGGIKPPEESALEWLSGERRRAAEARRVADAKRQRAAEAVRPEPVEVWRATL